MKKINGEHSQTIIPTTIDLSTNLNSNVKNKSKAFNKGIYNININNYNINTRRDLLRNCSSKTIELVKDLKKVIEQTETIKRRLFNSKRFFKGIKVNNNSKIKIRKKLNKDKDKKIIDDFKEYLSPINTKKTIELNNDANESLYISELFNDNKKVNKNSVDKTQTNNKNTYINLSTKNLNENIEEKYVIFKLGNLKKEGDILINENTFLSRKIKEYKTKIKDNFSYDKNYIHYFDENLNKFINSIKISLNNNLNSNLEFSRQIIKATKDIQLLKDNIVNEKQKKYINIQIEKNNENFNKLKEENNNLTYELENLKIYLKELKSKEKNLSFECDSKLKSRKEKNDLIIKLKSKIKNIYQTKKNIYQNQNQLIKVKNLKLCINKNDKYLNQIDKLKNIQKFLIKQKNVLTKENLRLKRVNNNIEINFDINIIKELKEELNNLKKNNFEKKLNIEKKEKQIKILKNIINKENRNNIKNKRTKSRYKKDLKEMAIKTYQNIINKKDMEISNLENEIENRNGILKIIENKVKPLYKKNNVLTKANSFIYLKRYNPIINIDSLENINLKSKEENLYDKIRRRKNKLLYMENINNNFDKKTHILNKFNLL